MIYLSSLQASPEDDRDYPYENSWGKEWGDSGLGYCHVQLASQFFEAWVIRGFDAPVPEPAPVVVPEPKNPVNPTAIGVTLLVAALVCIYLLK